jgi:hypothetical protein
LKRLIVVALVVVLVTIMSAPAALFAMGGGGGDNGGCKDKRGGKCEYPKKKVTICHKKKMTKKVPESAVAGHLRHGDTLGPCKKKDDNGHNNGGHNNGGHNNGGHNGKR